MNTWLTVTLILALAAFVCSIMNANGKCPVWVPLIILSIIAMLQAGIPLGK